VTIDRAPFWRSPSAEALRFSNSLVRTAPRVPAFNTAVSFATNTNWQAYGGETTMSYLTQMLGLTVQNFVSAATGHGGARGADPRLHAPQSRHDRQLLGRPDARTLYILLPLSLVLALVLVSQGVVQTFAAAPQRRAVSR
jgi:K+-transporting ATPase ATPase A chain